MEIQSALHVHGPHALGAPHRPQGSETASGARPQPVDQLDISREAQDLSHAREASGVRQDLVSRVRQEIADGVYETEAKLDAALDRLLDEIG